MRSRRFHENVATRAALTSYEATRYKHSMDYARHGRRISLLFLCLCAGGFACSAKPPATAAPDRATEPPARPATNPIADLPAQRAATRPATVLTLGKTVDGRPLALHLFGDTSAGPLN